MDEKRIMSNATRFLEERGIPYRLFVHSIAPTDLEEAARQRCQKTSQIVRSILFKTSDREYFLGLISGDV